MADFKAINTQDEFDERIKERIERAERKVRDEFKGWLSPDDVKKKDSEAADALEQVKKAHATELQRLADAHAEELKKYAGYDEKFTQQTARIHELEVNAIKTKVVNEKHLPFSAVEFITGEDEKAINESADRLSKLTQPISTGYTRNTEQHGDGKDTALRQMLSQIKG